MRQKKKRGLITPITLPDVSGGENLICEFRTIF